MKKSSRKNFWGPLIFILTVMAAFVILSITVGFPWNFAGVAVVILFVRLVWYLVEEK